MLAAQVFRGAAAATLAVGLALAGVGAPSATAADPGPVELAIIVPIVVPTGSTGLISADQLSEYTSPSGILSRQLDSAIDRPVTLAIDPMILASIRVLGRSAPSSAAQWLARLENARNESFLLAYADSDVTLGTQSASPTVLQPESFGFAIDPANFGPAATATPGTTPSQTPTATPTPTPSPTESVVPSLPTTDDLLAWDSDFADLVWPRSGTVADADLGALAASGYTSAIFSSSNVALPAGAGPAVTVGGLSGIVTDDTVSSRLSAVVNTSTIEVLQSTLPGVESAAIAAAQTQNGEGSVVAALDRLVPRPGTNAGSTIMLLQSSAAVTLVPLSEALDGRDPAEAALVPGAQGEERRAEAGRMLLAEESDARFATIVQDPSTITAPRRLALLALLSVGWMGNESAWTTAVQRHIDNSETLRSSVEIVTTSPFTLLADNGTLPIPVSNRLDEPVTVYLTVRPLTAKLAVSESRVQVTIEPNAQARAQVPVQAISNGSVQVVMTLSSASTASIGQPAITEINVQAGWETPIVLVIGGVVVLVFAGGIVRNIVRRRRPAQAEAAEPANHAGDADE